jgi:hypothetical protein
VTAGEDQPEPLVVDRAEGLGRVIVVDHLSLLVLVVALVLAPDPVDGLAVGGGGQPGAAVGGYAVGRPPLDGGRERLRRRLLDVGHAAAALQSVAYCGRPAGR